MAIRTNFFFVSLALVMSINICSGASKEKLQLCNSTDRVVAQYIRDFLLSYSKNKSNGDLALTLPMLAHDALEDLGRRTPDDFIKCRNDTIRIFLSLSPENMNHWANQILDAWAKPPPGIFFGDVNWLGSYQQCIKQYAPSNIKDHQEAFRGQYCTSKIYRAPKSDEQGKAKAKHISGTYISTSLELDVDSLHVGMCFPSTCTASTLTIIINKTLQYIPTAPFQSRVSCQPVEMRKITTRAACVIALLGLLGVILVLGTFYDLLFYQRNVRKAVAMRELAQSEQSTGSINDDATLLDADEHTPLSPSKIKEDVKASIDKEQGLIGRILMCFSVLNNCKRLFSVTPHGRNSIATLEAVHGIRFFSMTWVILGHTYYYSVVIVGIKNLMIAEDVLSRITSQAVLGATLSVDSFFVLSGLLVTFLSLRDMRNKGGIKKFNWVLFYVHRYWRLTIPYMIILGVNAALFEYMGSGPMWPTIDINVNCKKKWWTNLLYVNNFVNTEKQCMDWAWYLADDMQFYWITPIFLVSLFWKWRAGVAVSLLTLLTSLIATGVISAHYHFPASIQGEVAHPDQIGSGDYFDKVYSAPWCRIGSYMLGVLCGYILYKTNRKIKMHWALALLGWCLAVTINMLVVYGLYRYTKNEVELSNAAEAFYNAMHRSAWALGLCWVIFACVTGYGGPVNKLLSLPVLVPLSRLTYMAYLVHPIVIMSYMYQQKYQFNYDTYNIIYLFLGHTTMAYGVAFLTCIMFEAPFMALEKVILRCSLKRN